MVPMDWQLLEGVHSAGLHMIPATALMPAPVLLVARI